jgi:hypothetical protein
LGHYKLIIYNIFDYIKKLALFFYFICNNGLL